MYKSPSPLPEWARSSLPDYDETVTRDLDHVRLLAERIEAFLGGVRSTRAHAEKASDTDTVDLLTAMVTEFEKDAWFFTCHDERLVPGA